MYICTCIYVFICVYMYIYVYDILKSRKNKQRMSTLSSSFMCGIPVCASLAPTVCARFGNKM